MWLVVVDNGVEGGERFGVGDGRWSVAMATTVVAYFTPIGANENHPNWEKFFFTRFDLKFEK